MNRLRLDFSIDAIEDRVYFLNQYIKNGAFDDHPLTNEELEMCANYVLWGKDPDGKNMVQRKEIEIETRNKTWDKKEEESLNALMESPTFNESMFFQPHQPSTRIKKENFIREEALKKAPPHLIPIFENLFKEIDELDLVLNYYDLDHGRRKKPIREELLDLFTEEQKEKLRARSKKLNQFKYLKLRHHLVELRREQFTLRDTYTPTIQKEGIHLIELPPTVLTFDSDIPIYPIGLKTNQEISSLIFKPLELIYSQAYTPLQLWEVSDYLQKQQEEKKTPPKIFFSFLEVEHIYNLLQNYFELRESSIENEKESTTKFLLDTLDYYIRISNLSEIHQEILELRIRKEKNQKIAEYINKKFQKSYTPNYISTIFRQKIIKQIIDSAENHLNLIENLFYEENFKKCHKCGKVLLKDTSNFCRKSSSIDGFSNRCKRCDKLERQKKKEKKEAKTN